MENNPLISVIVPIYKVEEFLPTCLDSILAQTYKNLEIILVDDGSPDNCGMICDEYAKKDSRIIVIHKENGGLSDARNAGLDICTGELISFIDSDDFAHPAFFATLTSTIIRTNCDVAFCNFIPFHTPAIDYEKTSEIVNMKHLSGKYMIDNIYNREWVPKNIVVWNKIYKSHIFEHLRFPPGLNHEDEYIFLPIFSSVNEVVYIDRPLVYYRQRKDSIMSDRYCDNNFLAFTYILKERMKYSDHANNSIFKKKTFNHYLLYLSGAFIAESKNSELIIASERLFWKIIFNTTISWKSKCLFLLRSLGFSYPNHISRNNES